MSLRHNRYLRTAARRLPVANRYELRIEQLTARIHELESARQQRAGHDLWVPPGHFYSPFPPLDEMERREAEIFRGDFRTVPGVDLREDAQRAFLDEIHPLTTDVVFAATQAEARERGERYWTQNPAYADGDGLFLTAMLRHLQPQRLIELGCGYSSACTLDARDKYLGGRPEVTFVDPYTELLESVMRDGDRESVTMLRQGTQDVDLDLIRTLQAGDVLFIDSTHVARPGSDVNRIFNHILPAINPGVVVHLHDIFPNFEYPPDWVREGRGWTEQYVLRAFLQYNRDFEIVLWPVFMVCILGEEMLGRFPVMRGNFGGSFWFRKVG